MLLKSMLCKQQTCSCFILLVKGTRVACDIVPEQPTLCCSRLCTSIINCAAEKHAVQATDMFMFYSTGQGHTCGV